MTRTTAMGTEPAVANAGPWACFHCGDVFHDEREASLHFGPNEDYVAACVIKSRDRTLLRSLREAEAAAAEAWGLLHSESGDFAKAYHSAVSRHSVALIRAEESGYERGLYDSGRDELLAIAKKFQIFAQSGTNFFYPLGSLQELDAVIAKAEGQ